MTDLRTDYLGLHLDSPIVASAGPLTGDVERIVELERWGAAAIVLPSLFEEQIEHDMHEIDRLHTVHDESFGEATSFFPDLGVDSHLESHLALISNAKQRATIPVIASLNGTRMGGWLDYAGLLADAGADAIELNLYEVAADPTVGGAEIEAEHLAIVAAVAERVDVPVSVKISPHYSSISAFAVALQRAGASGVVMFNRFYLPDLDPDTLDVAPRLTLSTPEEVRLPMRWAGILREHLTMSIAASSGVHTGVDVAKLILTGADVAMTTSALLRNGAGHLAVVREELVDWMREHDYESVAQMRGAASNHATADPSAYERGNYVGNLASFTSAFLGGNSIGLRSR